MQAIPIEGLHPKITIVIDGHVDVIHVAALPEFELLGEVPGVLHLHYVFDRVG